MVKVVVVVAVVEEVGAFLYLCFRVDWKKKRAIEKKKSELKTPTPQVRTDYPPVDTRVQLSLQYIIKNNTPGRDLINNKNVTMYMFFFIFISIVQLKYELSRVSSLLSMFTV